MTVRYTNTLEDLVAFNRYHYAHSPEIKRSMRRIMVMVSILLVAMSIYLQPIGGVSLAVNIVVAISCAAFFLIVFSYYFPASLDRAFIRLNKEGANKGIIGQHELEIDADGFVERTEVNETRCLWHGVERIVETDEYVFIYISSLMAHVVPKRTPVTGDIDNFVARAKKLWITANQEKVAEREA